MYDVPVWREETSLLLFSISQDLDPFADYSLVVLPVHDIPELSLKLRRAQFCDLDSLGFLMVSVLETQLLK